MSTLDHNLVVGNSLTGIGTIGEVLDVFEPKRVPGQESLFAQEIRDALEKARVHLLRAARTAEATKQEVQDAAQAHRQAVLEAADARALMDAAVGIRLGVVTLDQALTPVQAIQAGNSDGVQRAIANLKVTHLPYLFPEVFLRPGGGFDCLLGNPPWEKVRWEATPYWAGIWPGLIALPDKQRDAKIAELRVEHPIAAQVEKQEEALRQVLQDLFKKVYTLRGGTHLELAQLMLERAIQIRRPTGWLGLVLPRQFTVLAGWKNLRATLTGQFDLRVVQGRNQAEWIFEDVEARYAVIFMSAGPASEPITRIWAAGKPSDVEAARDSNAIVLSQEDLDSFSETRVIPWFSTLAERRVFDGMRKYPRLASGKGWITATNDTRWDFTGTGPDRGLAKRDAQPGSWKILMTAHVDQFAFDTDEGFKQFVSDFLTLIGKRRGVELRYRTPVLTEAHPVITVRYPSRSDDSRTIIATALPEAGLLHNKGYAHAVMHDVASTENQRLALLGLLNTLPVDWWARRFVDRHVTAPVLNQLPLPAWSDANIAEAASMTSTLLARNGYTVLAGQITVTDQEPGTETQLRARLERLALDGYGLDHDALNLIAEDFNTTGFPVALRQELGVGQPAPQQQNRKGDAVA
jgi:hypothetical protein